MTSFDGLDMGAYGAVVADPPWAFKTYKPGGSRAIERHYDTMKFADICALPVRDLAAKDCHLFLWTTGPYLEKAFQVIKAWGFKFSGSGFVWIKLKRSFDPTQFRFVASSEFDLHLALGYTTRKNAEFCLLARRGNARRASKSVREVILSPVREHSRKPAEFRERVDQYVGPGIRVVELFSREPHPGWDQWGNEVTKFSTAHEPRRTGR